MRLHGKRSSEQDCATQGFCEGTAEMTNMASDKPEERTRSV